MKTILAAAAVAVTALTFQPGQAEARNGAYFGAGLALGIIGGAMLAPPVYAHPGYHNGYRPVRCWREPVAVVDRWGYQVGVRYVRRCG